MGQGKKHRADEGYAGREKGMETAKTYPPLTIKAVSHI